MLLSLYTFLISQRVLLVRLYGSTLFILISALVCLLALRLLAIPRFERGWVFSIITVPFLVLADLTF